MIVDQGLGLPLWATVVLLAITTLGISVGVSIAWLSEHYALVDVVEGEMIDGLRAHIALCQGKVRKQAHALKAKDKMIVRLQEQTHADRVYTDAMKRAAWDAVQTAGTPEHEESIKVLQSALFGLTVDGDDLLGIPTGREGGA